MPETNTGIEPSSQDAQTPEVELEHGPDIPDWRAAKTIEERVRIWMDMAMPEIRKSIHGLFFINQHFPSCLKTADFPGWENIENVNVSNRSVDRLRMVLQVIGEAWTFGPMWNQIFPLEKDEETGLAVLQFVARLGGIRARLLLSNRLMIRHPDHQYATKGADIFREYLLLSATSNQQWIHERSVFINTTKNMDFILSEAGLLAASRLADESLAADVLAFMRNKSVCPDILWSSLLWKVESLAKSISPSMNEEIRVLSGITPSSKQDSEILKRYEPLLSPFPLCRWPENTDWIDILRGKSVGAESAIQTMEGEVKLSKSVGRRVLKFRPILLLGAPGIGKTTFIRNMSNALNAPYIFVSLAGASDNMALKGSSRGWASGRPSFLADEILRVGVANPIVCLDEVDKIGTGRQNGRIWETLLALLEPASSHAVLDEYLLGNMNYSAVNWIATANEIEDLPAPLRSRFHIIRMYPPSPDDFNLIMAGILENIARDLEVDVWALPTLEQETIMELRKAFQRHPESIRRLARAVRHAIEWAAQIEYEQHSRMPQ